MGFPKMVLKVGLLSLIGLASPSLAWMTWSARAIDPSLIGAIRNDPKLLQETLFGEPPQDSVEEPKKDGRVDLSDKRLAHEVQASGARRKAEVGRTGTSGHLRNYVSVDRRTRC